MSSCSKCGVENPNDARFCRGCGGQLVTKIPRTSETMANCAYHPEADAVGACASCGKLVCVECKTVLGGKIYCNPCVDKQFSAKLETRVGRAETGVLAAENTSGQGSLAVTPRAIQGWNWGAFLLHWIWGVSNNVWIALLTLIPLVGFIMAIVLGVKGSEWAWQSKRWDSIEHFKRTQRTWAKWGIGLWAGVILLYIIIYIIIIVFAIAIGG